MFSSLLLKYFINEFAYYGMFLSCYTFLQNYVDVTKSKQISGITIQGKSKFRRVILARKKVFPALSLESRLNYQTSSINSYHSNGVNHVFDAGIQDYESLAQTIWYA